MAEVLVSPAAERDLRKSAQRKGGCAFLLGAMAAKERRRVLKRCLELGSGPFPEGKRVKQMRGFEPALYRLRVGDYRVLYRVEEDRVVLLAVIHRSELDRALNSLR